MTQRRHISPKFSRCSIMTRRSSPSLIQICAYLAFVTIAIGQDKCDKTKCPGPLAYYEALGCQPVYEKEDSCCATKYNCDHLKERSKTKCYVNGKEYEIGETLKEEDANPCDVGCTCRTGYDEIAAFTCAIVDCFFGSVKSGCYRQRSPSHCCPGEEICPESPEERPTCNVNGRIYKDGEYFNVENDPELNCVCQEGYKGENIEPFCLRPKRPYCSPDFRDASNIFNKCAPVYYSNQPPQTSCSVSSRCQNNNDTVIHNEDNSKAADGTLNDRDVCYFGNMTIPVGDELNQTTDYSSVCVKCVCEVPPVPTCQRLPDNECDVTKHPSFNDLSCRNTKQTVGAIYTRTNFVTLKYVTDAWGTNSNGFRLVITAVKDPKHTCKDFRCTQNEFCIETDLLCDGVNHCGDGSDEATSTLCANSEASTILGMQTTWFAIALVFLILSMGGLVMAAVLCFCKQRVPTPRHPHNAHNTQSHPPVSFPLQQMYGSNGASAGLPMGMTTLKGTTGTLGPLGNYGSGIAPGVMGATTLPRPGNWLRPAGLRLGHSAARVRLYCQAK